MTDPKQEPYEGQSPWALESIYYYQFYCCPECDTKVALKQDFIDHAFKFHPDSRLYFPNIMDGSLGNSQFHEIFFLTKFHFLLFQKWPKINF